MLECEISELSQSSSFKLFYEAISCYRGISLITAMTLITEIGPAVRFKHPEALVSYAGLGVREYSSGGNIRKGRITKTGNSLIRKTVIESVQSAVRPPQVHAALKRRRQGVQTEFIEVADRCMARLYKKSRRLLLREKHVNKVKVACARELLCFVWESLNKAEKLQARSLT
jgi:hypothetical protein